MQLRASYANWRIGCPHAKPELPGLSRRLHRPFTRVHESPFTRLGKDPRKKRSPPRRTARPPPAVLETAVLAGRRCDPRWSLCSTLDRVGSARSPPTKPAESCPLGSP